MSSKECSCCRRLKAWSFPSLYPGRKRPASRGHASPLYDTINSARRLTYPLQRFAASNQEYGLAASAPQVALSITVTLYCPKLGRGTARPARRYGAGAFFPVWGSSATGVGGSHMQTKSTLALLTGAALSIAPAATFAAPPSSRPPSSGSISPPVTTGQ